MIPLTSLEYSAITLSLKVAVTATLLSLPFGFAAAYVMTYRPFRGRVALDVLINLPLTLPPLVIGYLLLIILGPIAVRLSYELMMMAVLLVKNVMEINRKLAGWWHPGRAGNIALGPNLLASFGEIHPRVLRHYGIKGVAVGFTIHVANVPLPKTRTPSRPALMLSDLQAVERDFAFVVDANVEALTLVNAAAGADKALIERVTVFDQFTGLEGGKKSIAITARLQPRDKTLTDAEIEAVAAKIVEKVGKATGGVLRA